MSVLEATGLRKSFGPTAALAGVDLAVECGQLSAGALDRKLIRARVDDE